jgi:SAM-dependent methyltransferase
MSNWYEGWADRYAEWTVDGTDDVPFYVGLARDADGLLVELAVGNGRVAIPVAQATGWRVIGIDSSSAMLAQARVRAVEEGVELDLREGDIRELDIEEPAALIYCPGAVSAASAHVGRSSPLRCAGRGIASV